jgi:hypothetical protein
MKPRGRNEDRLGPVNPFTLGNVFVESALKLAWIEMEQEERHRQYFITSKGFEEMGKLGMDLEKVLHYRPSAPRQEEPLRTRTHRHRHPGRR